MCKETLSIADYVYVIADKKIIGQGHSQCHFQDPSRQLQQFIQGLPDGPVPFDYPAQTTGARFSGRNAS